MRDLIRLSPFVFRPPSLAKPSEVQNPSSVVRRPSSAVLIGWYGSDNIGDEAVLEATVSALRERGITDLHVLSTNPARTAKQLGVTSSRRNLSLETLRALHGAKALVLGGGGLIQDGTSVYNLPIYALFVAIARLMGLKVVGWGLGVEPIWTKLGKLLTRFICRSSAYFSVRDRVSLRLLLKAGVPASQVEVTTDPAFLINPPHPTRGTSSNAPKVIFCLRSLSDNHPGINLHYLLPVSVRQRLGVGWRPPPERKERLVDALARGVAVCVSEFGATVEMLPLWPGRDDAMLDAVEQEAHKLGVHPEKIRRAEVEQTPRSIASYLASADMLVSMRLHALIFAASAGVPSLALAYARKMRGLMASLGMARWVVEVDRRSPPPEEVEMKLRQLWSLRPQEGRKIEAAAERARHRAENDADTIIGVLTR
jgi:polysaccharide pyruvyl transferase CsaB